MLDGLIKQLLERDIAMLLEWQDREQKEFNIQIDHIHLVASTTKVVDFEVDECVEGKNSGQNIQELPSAKSEILSEQPLLVTRILCAYHWPG